jgi:DNA-binding CsgD family transcriptional regulator
VLQIGILQALRASKKIVVGACVDSFDLLPSIVHGLPPSVLVILPNDAEILPDIVKQAGNVVCFSPTGALKGIAATSLTAQMLEDRVLLAGAKMPLGQDLRQADLISAAFSAANQKAHLLHHRPALQLTRHQIEVMALIIKGLTNREIAHVLGISLPTARYHVSTILAKLGVSNRTEASAMAIHLNLLSNDDR